MKSMTGYGEAQYLSENVSIEVKIRSVNGRFLETRIHLPKEFLNLESDIKKSIEAHFHRGTVDVYVSLLKAQTDAVEMKMNMDLVKQYELHFKKLCKELKIKSPMHPEAIMRWPEVITMQEKKQDADGTSKKIQKKILELVGKACKACDIEKIREGQSLLNEFENLLGLLDKEVQAIESQRDEANQYLENRIKQKIESRMGEKIKEQLDPNRLAQEVIFQLEKSDISEEVMRLKEHLRNYRDLLKAEKVGKKMDFYTQELLRETNTIGSKSGLSSLTQRVVESKAIIERVREQVQNVE